MKQIGVLLLASSLSFSAFTQTVSSSCTTSDSVKALYKNDADRLALRIINAQNLTFTDSVEIPQQHSDTILNALIAVYNAFSLPARDTVLAQLSIHTFPNPRMEEIFIQADSILFWMDSLQLGDFTAGQPIIDDLILFYEFSNITYNATPWSINDIVVFNSDSNYNLQPLIDSLNLIPGMVNASANDFLGDGNDITGTIYADHVELIYNYGWGDCVAGCISNRYWKFKVYYDCTVEYVESWGNLIYYFDLKNPKISTTQVYPNPFSDYLILPEMFEAFRYEIYNSAGQKVLSSGSLENKISGLGTLPEGNYLLMLTTSDTIYTCQILKIK